MADPIPEHTPQDDTIAPVPADDLRARLSAVMSALGDDRPGAVESVIAAVSPVLERQRIANRALKTAVVEALERAEQAEAERDRVDEARRLDVKWRQAAEAQVAALLEGMQNLVGKAEPRTVYAPKKVIDAAALTALIDASGGAQ